MQIKLDIHKAHHCIVFIDIALAFYILFNVFPSAKLTKMQFWVVARVLLSGFWVFRVIAMALF